MAKQNKEPKLEINIVREKQIEKVEDTKPSEPKLEMEVWRMYSPVVFGIQPEIFDGAFYGLTGEYTKSECREIINKFLNKPIIN